MEHHPSLVEEALRTHKRLMQLVHAATSAEWLHIDLTMTQIKALFALAEAHDLTVGQIAARLGIGRPAASIVVDALVQQGLAGRDEDRADRRRTIVHLSPAGEDLVERLYRGEHDLLRDWFGRLSEDDLRALIRCMEALCAAAPAHTIPTTADVQPAS